MQHQHVSLKMVSQRVSIHSAPWDTLVASFVNQKKKKKKLAMAATQIQILNPT